MRIAVWHNLPTGGGLRAMVDHVTGLSRAGHHVEVWVPPTAEREMFSLEGVVATHVVPLEKPRLPAFELPRFGHGVREMRARLAAMQQHAKRCAADITAGGYEVLFAGACQHFRASFVAQHLDIPSAIYLQEPYRPLYEAWPSLHWVREEDEDQPTILREVRYYNRMRAMRTQARAELDAVKAFDRILVNSHYSRESVLRAYGLDSDVCYLGVDAERFRPNGGDRSGFVLGVGAYVREKNLEMVIEALARIPHGRRPPLVWVGNVAYPAYREAMLELAARRGVELDARVRVSEAELLELYGTAMLMVYAPRLEPFGYAPLEAAACELPVVAVAEGGVRETVVDGVTGRLVPSDPDELAAAVADLAAAPARRRKLGQAGRHAVLERWALAAALERLEARLTSLTRTAGA